MIIEKDKYLSKWVVWLIRKNLQIMVYQGTSKKECKEWRLNNEKRVSRKIYF